MPNWLTGSLIGVAFIVVWCGVGGAAEAVGSALAISGQCFVQTDGKRIPLKLGDAVHVGDVLDVPAPAKLKLRMEDGSVLSVASDSQLTITAYTVDPGGKRQNAELSLGQGLLRALVASVDHPAIFEVKTATGVSGVRGTDWFVEAQPGTMVVAVLSGSVALTSKSNGAVVVVPSGSGASVAAGEDPTPPRVWRPAEFNAVIARTALAERRHPANEFIPPAPGGYGPYPRGGDYDRPPSGRYNQAPRETYQPPGSGYR
jgi:hypothetical protein